MAGGPALEGGAVGGRRSSPRPSG
uniref:Uncharacterized protein n=1 Tax=Arundo donax TaxID=35708 RepID=A0A0A9ABV5_ARUDO